MEKKRSEDNPWEGLAKFGYKPIMKYKNFNQLSIFMATRWKPKYKDLKKHLLSFFCLVPLTSGDLKLFKITSILEIVISLSGEISFAS